jgi:predicted phosphodiesterase
MIKKIAFFADLHIQTSQLQSQTDFGAPSKLLPKLAAKSIKSINPDLLFGLGDQTAFGSETDWLGYKKWRDQFSMPIYEIFGNHDRNYNIYSLVDHGRQYFELLGYVSDTKAIKIGNLIFILVSEEHNPESSEIELTSTIPKKRFDFIEKVLAKYCEKNNVFVLSHTPIMGTTVLSDTWIFNDLQASKAMSGRYLSLYKKYPVVAHISGHVHVDYRKKSKVIMPDGEKSKDKIGKFIDGHNYSSLPNMFFLNMPCVATSHGLPGSTFPWLNIFTRNSHKNQTTKARSIFFNKENKRFSIWDFKLSHFPTLPPRSALYYFNLVSDSNYLEVITHWIEANYEVERTKINLFHPLKLGKRISYLRSDLSLRDYSNIHIIDYDWFLIKPKTKAWAMFSICYPRKRKLTKVKIIGQNVDNYRIFYKGSKNKGKSWSVNWFNDLSKLSEVNALMMKVEFASGVKEMRVERIEIK